MLTDRQKEELNRAIADYLKQSGYSLAHEAFKEEAEVSGEDGAKYNNLLEKKWVSVIRLQKKVLELQSQVKDVQKEVKEVSDPGNVLRRKDPSQWLPRPPPAYTLNGHRSPITCVIFHPNFSICCSASEDATIKLWDFESGEFERTLKGHTDSVNSIAMDPLGKLLASSSADMTIKIWDFQSGDFECLKTLHGHDHNVSCVRFLNSDVLISSSRDKSIKIWNVESGYCISTLKGHLDWVRRAIPSPCGKLIASCSNDKSVRVWDFEKKEIKTEFHDHDHVIEDVQWAAPTSTPFIQKAVGATGDSSSNTTTPSSPQSSSSSSISRYLASASRDKTIKFWDLQTQSILFTFKGHDNWVRGLKFHPGGRYLLSVSDDKSVKSWDIENQRCFKTLSEAHEHFVGCIDMHSKGNRIITGSVDTKVSLWDCR